VPLPTHSATHRRCSVGVVHFGGALDSELGRINAQAKLTLLELWGRSFSGLAARPFPQHTENPDHHTDDEHPRQ
jgi:hypothetical protein